MNEWIENRGSRASLHQQMGRGRGAHPPFLLSIIQGEFLAPTGALIVIVVYYTSGRQATF